MTRYTLSAEETAAMHKAVADYAIRFGVTEVEAMRVLESLMAEEFDKQAGRWWNNLLLTGQ